MKQLRYLFTLLITAGLLAGSLLPSWTVKAQGSSCADGVIAIDPEDPVNEIPQDQLPVSQESLNIEKSAPSDRTWLENTPIELDDRTKVTDTTVFPYSAICKLHMYFQDESTNELKHYIGSGFLISPTTVLTCAHCVYDYGASGEVRRIIIVPGSTSDVDPWGMLDSAQGDIAKITYDPVYAATGHSSLDVALIQLSQPVGEQTDYIRLATGAMSNESLHLSGYPAQVRGVVDDDNQYEAWGKPLMTYDRQIDFTIAASGGQSGSPVMNERHEAVAVFSTSYESYPVNGGTLIDSARLKFIADHSDMEKPVYRAYNPNTGEHFYTMDYEELASLGTMGWNDEGLAWRSADAQSGLPVYRLYEPVRGDHHYTANARERNVLLSYGWNDEGIAWYAPQSDEYCRIYRLYNPNEPVGQHHFTRDEKEKNVLISMGWNYEGIPFNAR